MIFGKTIEDNIIHAEILFLRKMISFKLVLCNNHANCVVHHVLHIVTLDMFSVLLNDFVIQLMK